MSLDTQSGSSLERVRLDEPPVKQIYQTLLGAILSLDLPPGTRVSEAEIARQVGASRTPVRAALARLVEDGLIETRPSRGNYVTRLSADATREAHFIRDALETAIVAALARNGMSDTAARRLDRNVESAASAAERGDTTRFGKLDDEFHRLLAAATHNARLVQVYEREKTGLTRLRALCPADRIYMGMIVDEHRGVLEAIEHGDEALARTRLSAHISRALVVLDDMQRQHADYFIDD